MHISAACSVQTAVDWSQAGLFFSKIDSKLIRAFSSPKRLTYTQIGCHGVQISGYYTNNVSTAEPLFAILFNYLGLQIMTTSSPSETRLSAAISELEKALSALDQTVYAFNQSLSETSAPEPQTPSAANRDMIPAGQVRKELAALQELVSGAVELIALARSGTGKDVTN